MAPAVGSVAVRPPTECDVVVVGHRSAEVAVRPLLGQLAGLAEHDRHGWEPDLGFGEPLGNEGWSDSV